MMDDNVNMALLWNSSSRTYQGIREIAGEWFVQVDLGIDYARAKNYVEEWNHDED